MSRTKMMQNYPVIYIHSLDPYEMPSIILDEQGRLVADETEKEALATRLSNLLQSTNQQLYLQIVKSYKQDSQSIVVVLQASLVSADLNLKTVSHLMCGHRFCCNQLFTRYLYKSTIKFKFVPGKFETQKLQILYHKHANDGALNIIFHGDDDE